MARMQLGCDTPLNFEIKTPNGYFNNNLIFKQFSANLIISLGFFPGILIRD